MSLLRVRAFGALFGAASVLACATDKADGDPRTNGGARDAASETLPPEDRRIALTMFPFWSLPIGPNGFGSAEPLAGVKVCVAGARPYAPTSSSFADVGTPCAPPSVPGEKLVFEGVPATAEVLMTAELEGYRPSLYPVTTWNWDQDGTNGSFDAYQMSLTPSEDVTKLFPASDARLGAIMLYALVCRCCDGGAACRFLGGATVSIDPLGESDSGPYYQKGGKWIAGAETTAAGELPLAAPDLTQYASAHFVNLIGAQYSVHVDHPYASCLVWGSRESFRVRRRYVG